MQNLNQKGFAQILVLLLLLAGIAVGVYLVQQKTNFLPKANDITPTLSQTSSFPLGINISLSESTAYDFWNTHALSTDIVSSYVKDINLLTSAEAGIKFLFTQFNNPEASMDLAVSHNIGYVTANIETTDLDLQIASESAQYSMAKAKGLKFIFAPMGYILEESYSYQDYAMLKNADYIFYQTQYLQDSSRNLGTTDPSQQITNYAARVKGLISKIKPYIVEHKVWVQVSVNPPDNRCITAERVIQYIDSIEDGSQNSPDGIIIFYASKYDTTGDRQDDGNCLSKGFPSRVDVMKQVIEHYRPAPTPTPIPSKQDHEKKGKKLSVTVEARFYANVKDQLKTGDLLSMPAVRQSANTPMTVDNWKFKQAVAALNSVDGEIDLQKGIFLSAVADVQNLINNIPVNVNWVAYNMEPGMTPASDLQNPVNSVRQFANVVHNSGRKMGFAPLRSYIDNNQGTIQMSDIINSVDAISYQGQLLLPTMSEEDFVKTVKEKYNYVKGINPNTQFHLQLWLGRQTSDQMAKAFNRSDKYFDNAVIGTHSDLEGILQVLPQLKWR